MSSVLETNWTDEYSDDPTQVQGRVPREETPLEGEPTPDEKAVHNFLLKPDYSQSDVHPMTVMAAIRERIEGLPETVSTFPLKRLVEDDDPFKTNHIRPEMLVMCGSWKASDHFNNRDSRPSRWVNPAHEDAARYSDAVVRCECGTLVAHDNPAGDDRAPDLPYKVDDHADDCLKHWRYESRAQLCRNRKRILEEAVPLGNSGNSLYPRMGICYQSTISHITNELGVSCQELTEEFRERRRNTIVELLVRFDADTIGSAYGLGRKRVNEIVRNQAGFESTKSFYAARKRNRAIYRELDRTGQGSGR